MYYTGLDPSTNMLLQSVYDFTVRKTLTKPGRSQYTKPTPRRVMMAESDRDPQIVFLAETPQLADAVVQLLASNNIAAEMITPPMETSSSPLTGMSAMSAPEGYEIRVLEVSQVTQARELLETAESVAAVKAVREKRANRTGTVKAECEECGHESEWPAIAMGTTESCPNCGAYMDIPDPDDDWSDVDFGKGEEEEESTEETT
jgi:predicted Zn-ribbon and HTH transcriptional regulator